MTGIRQTTISEYTNGKSLPSVEKFFAISRALGVSMDWLWTGAEHANGNPTDQSSEESTWKRRAMDAEERLERLEKILQELFAFAKIGKK